jgi:hypothetical protein
MNEIVFHIGTHKTGTTTLQRSLHRVRAQGQLDGLGVYYPDAGRIGRDGHHNLVYELVSRWRFNPALGGWDALEAELKGRDEPVVLVSSESLSGYRAQPEIAERCAALATALNRRPRVVAYLRPQFAFLESIYAQNAATGYTGRKFDRYLLDSIAQGAADYSAVLHNWQQQFGQCEVFAFMPEPGRPLLAQVFDEVLGIALPGTVEELRANDRRGVRAVEFGRRVTEVQERAGAAMALRTALAKRVSDICAGMFPEEPRFAAMDAELAATVQEIFGAANQALFATYPALEPAFAEILRRHDRKPNALDLDSAGPNLRGEYETVLCQALRNAPGAEARTGADGKAGGKAGTGAGGKAGTGAGGKAGAGGRVGGRAKAGAGGRTGGRAGTGKV